MVARRSYADSCAAAHALDLVGERWALLVVRELVLGPKRFSELRAGLPGISPNVLSQRLHDLERAAVVRHRKLPPPASWVYELTEWGQGLGPIIVDLGRWGAGSPSLPRAGCRSADSLMLSLRSTFRPEVAAGAAGTSLELRFGDDRFHVRVEDGGVEISRGSVSAPDAIVDTAPATLSALIYDGDDLDRARRDGDLVLRGDIAVLRRFLACFALPEPAAAPAVDVRQGPDT